MNKEELKAEFRKLWPDALQVLELEYSEHYVSASCLWVGFKRGYELGSGVKVD